jgi:hypothetical protein
MASGSLSRPSASSSTGSERENRPVSDTSPRDPIAGVIISEGDVEPPTRYSARVKTEVG